MKPLNHYLTRITGASFKKYGFSRDEILTDWELIVGKDFAKVTAPEKLVWPTRQASSHEASTSSGSSVRGKFSRASQGANLRLRVEPHAILEIDYQSNAILERINSYFGYRAVTRLTFVQGPVAHAASRPTPQKPKTAPQSLPPSGFDDPDLAAALQKLGQAIKQKQT